MIERLSAAKTIAREAGSILREGYGRPHEVKFKGEVDLVTDYDMRSEEHILDRLTTLFPTDAIRAEETRHATPRGASEFEWYVDPLDGTTNFAHSFPFFAVSIAILHRNCVIAGVVFDPLRDELFAACKSEGATLNGHSIRVSETAELDHSLLATGFPYDVRTAHNNNLVEFSLFAVQARGVRRAGAAALDLCYTASSRLDGFWELRLKPWDVAAGAMIVEEAGGRITDINGGRTWLSNPSVIASNGLIHSEMLSVIRGAQI